MKKKVVILLNLTIMVCMLSIASGWCHGVDSTIDRVEATCIMARYDDGEPMSYAAVEIRAPESDIAFQTGRTDRNGCFMVKTDAPGTWLAVVSDGMGHRLTLDFSVAGDEREEQQIKPSTAEPVSNHASRPLKVVAGVSIIVGLCGFFYGWKARRTD